MIKSGNIKTSWEDINKNMLTNPDIQSIKVLEGTHYLHHEQVDKISEISKEFIKNCPKKSNLLKTNYSTKSGIIFNWCEVS